MLTNDQIKKFQEIWKQRFRREISDEEAERESSRIVRLMELICKPSAKDKNNQKHNKETE